jgi:hypothetical protein
MFSIGQALYLDVDFKKAKLAQLPVLVRHADNGEIADPGGSIEELTDAAVKINGVVYIKAVYRFFVR